MGWAMLAFVTSLRAKALAADWNHHIWLLQRTLNSFLAQTHPDFIVVVVCHDVPDIPQLQNSKVKVLTVDFPPPARNFEAMTTDKAFKISRGAQWATASGADYVMFADADDLVSSRLSNWVERNSGEPGWYFSTGWSGRHGARFLQRLDRFDQICGTCAIVRTDCLGFEAHPFYRGAVGSAFIASGHPNYKSYVRSRGAELKPLPFAGAIYIQHGDSTARRLHTGPVTEAGRWASRVGLRSALRCVRDELVHLKSLRPLTPAIDEEFSFRKSLRQTLESAGQRMA